MNTAHIQYKHIFGEYADGISILHDMDKWKGLGSKCNLYAYEKKDGKQVMFSYEETYALVSLNDKDEYAIYMTSALVDASPLFHAINKEFNFNNGATIAAFIILACEEFRELVTKHQDAGIMEFMIGALKCLKKGTKRGMCFNEVSTEFEPVEDMKLMGISERDISCFVAPRKFIFHKFVMFHNPVKVKRNCTNITIAKKHYELEINDELHDMLCKNSVSKDTAWYYVVLMLTAGILTGVIDMYIPVDELFDMCMYGRSIYYDVFFKDNILY